MLWKRAREEIMLTKKEIINYMQYLVSTRSSLEDLKSFQGQDADDDELKYAKGKAIVAFAEIKRLNVKIQTSIEILHLHSLDDFASSIQDGTTLTRTENELQHSEEDFNEYSPSDYDSDVSDELLLDSEEVEPSDDQSMSSNTHHSSDEFVQSD